ncbi:hypothetical protein [Flavobacterium aquicola]|uniref:Uncharacterized protein n=1 Tax=Flavobacterium aquicola TaxID=1682742 RepID=A0A3E0EUS2_9FLAO|nr:hypothetical protein [Flavobacterium aquicola]REH01943.1 hypothetical protein C8P67_101428 [Flavobacterium aquicola]
MKQLLYLFIVLFFNQLHSQTVFVQTIYKSIPPQEFSLEKNDFNFDLKEGILLKKNSQDNVESKYYIEFKKEFYDADNNFYFVEYKTDFKKHNQNLGSKSDVGIFTIMYDKKDGTVLTVILNFLEADGAALYLTEKGEESPKVKSLFE